MVSLKKSLLRAPLGLLARSGWRAPFLHILKSVIAEHPDNRVVPGQEPITVLALSPEGFRGDLEALARSGKCRVLLMKTTWQYRFLYFFYQEGLRIRDYLNPQPGSAEVQSKKALQEFYRAILPDVYRHFSVDCIISYHIRLYADVDWGMASHDLGVPYVVLYREGTFASAPELKKTLTRYFGYFGFWGTHLVVHNDSCRRLCIDTGFVAPKKVSALGCIRMDGFLERIKQDLDARSQRRKVALFPTILREGAKLGLQLLPFFNGVHVALAQLAAKHPDIDFVIKPKPKDYLQWRARADKAFAEAGIDVAKLHNIVIDHQLDAQDLIMMSSVVCGINSTTILEAAIAGKPVVVPYFEQLREKPYVDSIKFLEAFEYLDVAKDPEGFSKLVEDRLARPEISEPAAAGRRAMFAKYVSNPDGGALDNYIGLLQRLVAESSARRTRSLSASTARESTTHPVGSEHARREQHGA